MELPIFKVLIDGDELGIDKISLVEYPAVDVNFLAFSNDKKELMLSVDDEEQRIITGVVARADYPIYRYDNGYEYYIVFDRDIIKEMAIKLLTDNHQNEVNIEHKINSDVDGVQMLELYIKDSSKGINPKGFENISDGSLFATYKVFNDDIWKAVKEGKFKGFSLEGMFVLEQEIDDDITLDEIMNMLNKIEEKIKQK
jgi:hypothetical protein